MMIAPSCPDHDRLVLDLALGRLDDEAAAEADAVIESCAVCGAWWRERFEGATADGVDEVVASTLGELRLPARRRSHRWLAAAAVAVMVFGASALWLTRETGTAAPERVEVTAIQSIDFEDAELQPLAIAASADLDERQVTQQAAFSPAPVRAEEIRIAEAPPIDAEINPEPLFNGGFESGDLTGWGSGT